MQVLAANGQSGAASAVSSGTNPVSSTDPQSNIETTVYADGSRGEYWSDDTSWWYREYDAQGNLVHEESGTFDPTSANSGLNTAYQTNQAANDAGKPETPPAPVRADDHSGSATDNIPGDAASQVVPSTGIVTFLAKPRLESLDENFFPPELNGFRGKIEKLGNGLFGLTDAQGKFVGIYDIETGRVHWSDNGQEYSIPLEDIIDRASRDKTTPKSWQELFRDIGLPERAIPQLPPTSYPSPGDTNSSDTDPLPSIEQSLSPGNIPTHNYNGNQHELLEIGRGFSHLGEIIVAGQPSPISRGTGVGASRRNASTEILPFDAGPIHHIATNKNFKSALNGGPWSARFEKMFRRAGMSLDDALNKVRVPGHKGPHPEIYHSTIFDRLRAATNGLSGNAYNQGLRSELRKLAAELRTPGSLLNKLVTGT